MTAMRGIANSAGLGCHCESTLAKTFEVDYLTKRPERNPQMGKHGKLLEKVLSKEADATIRFDELCFFLSDLVSTHAARRATSYSGRLGFRTRSIFRKTGLMPSHTKSNKFAP